MSDHHNNTHNRSSFPLSLGKPSLRRRLEAYYSLVAPTVIEDTEDWLKRFDQIYLKYGGTVQGMLELTGGLVAIV